MSKIDLLKEDFPLTERELNAVVSKVNQLHDDGVVRTTCRFRDNQAHILRIRTLAGQWGSGQGEARRPHLPLNSQGMQAEHQDGLAVFHEMFLSVARRNHHGKL